MNICTVKVYMVLYLKEAATILSGNSQLSLGEFGEAGDNCLDRGSKS
jgi:hypothetical protein